MIRELGAYGLRLGGVTHAARLMIAQAPGAPMLELRVQPAPPDESPSFIGRDAADLRLLGGGRLRARRGEGVVTFALPEPVRPDELVHPYLAAAAALVWQWEAREALHGGVFTFGEGAIVLFGGKESGKSTTLARLAGERDAAVLADDLAVLDGGRALAGPRSLDLRPNGRRCEGDPVRRGERIRIQLPPSPPSMPVAGSIMLDWGAEVKVQQVPVRDRLAVLAAQRTYPLPGDPVALLELATRPIYAITRPRTLDALAATIAAVRRCFGKRGPT